MVSYMNDDRVTRYITDGVPQPYSPADAQWWIDVGSHSDLIKAIEFDGVLAGCISATPGSFEYHRSAELGYWVGREFWNRGIATQAVREFTQLMYETTKIMRLFNSVVSDNGASIRVLEKNGFRQEGALEKASFKNGQFFDECLFSKIRP